MLESNLEKLAQAAARGDDAAARDLLASLVDDVHRLALRMLWHPIDAEDATEEILIDVLLHVAELQSDVRSGVMRIASRFLLRTYESPMERQEWSFDEMSAHLDRGIAEEVPVDMPSEVRTVFAEEVKIGCTQTMLLCLDRPHRLAYVLVDVMEFDEIAAAHMIGIEPALFRVLAESARERLHAFMQTRCGVVNPASPCRCDRRLGRDLRTGRVDPRRLLFVVPDRATTSVPSRTSAHRPVALDPARIFRGQELRPAPSWIVERVSAFLDANEPELLRA